MEGENNTDFIEDDIDRLASSAHSDSTDQSNVPPVHAEGEVPPADEDSTDAGSEENKDLASPEGAADADAVVGGEDKEAFDVNKYLEESSGGLFKSEDDFKTSLSKIQEYDILKSRISELEVEKESIFANDEIKLLNDLHKQGKTSEQIEEFTKLRKLGDLSAVDAQEILVQDYISKGNSRLVAEKLIERKYGLNSISLDADELTDEELAHNREEIELIKATMQMDAEPVRNELIEKVNSLSKPIDATQTALAKAASEKAYRDKLEPFVSKLMDDFPSKIEITEGIDFEVDQEFKDSAKSVAYEHFLDNDVSQERVDSFISIQKAIFLAQNKDKIFKAIQDQTRTAVTEEVEAKYVNNNGLERAGAVLSPASQTMSNDDYVDYAMEMAK